LCDLRIVMKWHWSHAVRPKFPGVALLVCLWASFMFAVSVNSCRRPLDDDPSVSEETEGYGKLAFSSSDRLLVERFAWAKEQALAYVFEGDPVGAWYEAALPGREAFCMRDVSHQAMGAHALGLAAWNRNMLEKFAVNISDTRDWCTYWEINRYDEPAPVDYRNDKEFWYNLPANFDVMDCCWRMYLWTGDRTYIDDAVFLNFYERTAKDYVERWNLELEKIMTRARFMNREYFDSEDSFHICRGIPSYHEGRPGNTQVGADLLAFQSAAYLAYAEILDMKGYGKEAEIFRNKAEEIRDFIGQEWWDSENKAFHTIYKTDGGYSKEGNLQAFLLYKDVLMPGEKREQTLRDLSQMLPVNIEMKSYYPEILYRYGDPAKASRILLELSDPGTRRREYPEVSYAVIGSIVNGLMGIEPDARYGTVKTLSRLPDETAWAELDFVPVFGKEIKVRHIGNTETALTNRSNERLEWIACFYADGDELLVDGSTVRAERSVDQAGCSVLQIDVAVGPRETHSVKVKRPLPFCVGFLPMENDGSCHGFLPRPSSLHPSPSGNPSAVGGRRAPPAAPPVFFSLSPTQNGREPSKIDSSSLIPEGAGRVCPRRFECLEADCQKGDAVG
jgi:hypothetical protein